MNTTEICGTVSRPRREEHGETDQSNDIQREQQPIAPGADLLVEGGPRLGQGQQARGLAEQAQAEGLVADVGGEDLAGHGRGDGPVAPAVGEADDEEHGDLDDGGGFVVVAWVGGGQGGEDQEGEGLDGEAPDQERLAAEAVDCEGVDEDDEEL